jgi:hypothetical protein
VKRRIRCLLLLSGRLRKKMRNEKKTRSGESKK